jgi:hypothetical protein
VTSELTTQQLDEIETRAASLHEYALLADKPLQADADQLTGKDVPALIAELRRLKADVDKLRADAASELLPTWEAMYEPGNVSDYLIGYANSEAAAKGAAVAWLRSQKDQLGRLEWVPQTPLDGYDAEAELIERHDDGVDIGPGIVVRHRAPAAVSSVV